MSVNVRFARVAQMPARAVIVAVGLASAIIMACAVALSSARATAGAPSPAALVLPAVFHSDDGETALAVQLDSGGLETPGSFDFQVARVGVYSGVISPRPSGPQIVHLQGDATSVQFTPGNGDASQPATVRMEGEINTAHHTASINVWANSTHYHLETTAPNAGAAQTVAQRILSATVVQDWPTVYGLLAPELQANLTQPAFIAQRASAGVPKVLSGTLTGSGQVSVDATGITHFAQPMSLVVQMPDGSTRQATSTMYLTFENGSWLFLTTSSLS